jgi:hypothetical protein
MLQLARCLWTRTVSRSSRFTILPVPVLGSEPSTNSISRGILKRAMRPARYPFSSSSVTVWGRHHGALDHRRMGHIARVQPTARADGCRGGLWILVIAIHHLAAADHQVADGLHAATRDDSVRP